MKIGFDVSQAVYGTGVSDYTINLITALQKNLSADQLILFGSALRRYNDLSRLYPKAKLLHFPPASMHLLWNLLHLVNVETFIGRVDVFHSSDWTQPPGRAAKVTTVHDLAPIIYPGEHDSQIVSVHRARLKWVVRECRAVICVSRSTADDFVRLFKYPKSQVHIISEALPARFKITPEKLNIGDYLLALGARQPRKNIPRLISAFHKYKSRYRLPDKLIIVGENSGQTPASDVIYTGYISDRELVNYLASASGFVYPSLYEGFGLPVLAAFYHHIPVSASNCSSLPEVVGNSAVLFDPLSEEGIAESISRSLKNKKALIESGLRQLRKFSWDQAARETLSVYQKLC
jgi:glycosyltransferase involved in cell wall biosynthesis